MHKVDVDSLLQGKQSKYALVVGVAKGTDCNRG